MALVVVLVLMMTMVMLCVDDDNDNDDIDHDNDDDDDDNDDDDAEGTKKEEGKKNYLPNGWPDPRSPRCRNCAQRIVTIHTFSYILLYFGTF